MPESEKYFNLPIQLLSGFMQDSFKILNDIFDYCLYVKAQKLEGSETKRFQDAGTYFGAKIGNVRKTAENGQRLFDSIPANSPMTGMSLNIFWDFYKNYKTDFEKVCLLGYLGLKSIIQNKPYCCIGNAFWLARMDGKVISVKDFGELSDEIRKYANEYQTVKIKRALRDSWNLKFYSYHLKGCYYSFTLPQDELVFQAEKTRKKNKEIAAKKLDYLARQKALARLNAVTTN